MRSSTAPRSCIVLEYEIGPIGAFFPLEIEDHIGSEVLYCLALEFLLLCRPTGCNQVTSEFLNNYIFDRLRTQSQVPNLLAVSAPCPLPPAPCPLPLDRALQLGYVVQAWTASKHGIGRIRVMRRLHITWHIASRAPR